MTESTMTESTITKGRNDYIPRRAVLAASALSLTAAAAAAAMSQAAAQQKISQVVAKYQDTPNGDQHCDGCFNLQPLNACKFVQGDISPSGWCQLFSKKT
jgi:hypothetical protein